MQFSRRYPCAVAAVSALAVTLVAGCADPPGMTDVQPSRSVITSTTEVADAGVLGNLRRPDDSCPAEPAPVDPGPPTRTVNSGTERGDVEVPADPQRIVALSGAQLDALCALGLQARVVAAALPDGSDQQPAYLGTAIHDLPGVGTRSAPDLAAIAAAGPDLILGGQAPQPSGDYFAIAPTVLMADSADRWQDTVRAVGAATGRRQAADELLGRFADQAAQAGRDNDAQHFQASVVQLTDTGVRIFGATNFPASVLAAVGVDRPATQRFTDSPYIELGSDDDLAAADADLIFVSFASPAARDRAAGFFSGDSWRALSAARDHRVYVVNNEIWQAGDGLIAARGIVDDLRVVNAPIN